MSRTLPGRQEARALKMEGAPHAKLCHAKKARKSEKRPRVQQKKLKVRLMVALEALL